MNGKCRLCLKQVSLCKSHIIPEFFYEQMDIYDEKHRFNVLTSEFRKHPFSAQKGLRERLLCKQCEGKFSKWEDYARRVLYGGARIEVTTSDPRGSECKVDYTKFKLFQLSLLWRVGISTHPAFSSAELGNHEAIIREILFKEIPVSADCYGCVMIYSTKHANITANAIHCMGVSEVEGIPCVRLMLGGLFWLFFLSETSNDSRRSGLFLQETGMLRILRTDSDPGRYIEILTKELYTANADFFEQRGKVVR